MKNFYLKKGVTQGNENNLQSLEYYQKNDENNEELNCEKSFYDIHGNFDQLTINNYKPGDGIPPHIDTHSPFEDVKFK